MVGLKMHIEPRYQHTLRAVIVKNSYFSEIHMYHEKQVFDLGNERGVITQNILEAT